MRIVLKFYRIGNAAICEALCTEGVPDEQGTMITDDDGHQLCSSTHMSWGSDRAICLTGVLGAPCACRAYNSAEEAREAIQHFVALVAQLNRRDGDGNAGMDVSLAH